MEIRQEIPTSIDIFPVSVSYNIKCILIRMYYMMILYIFNALSRHVIFSPFFQIE